MLEADRKRVSPRQIGVREFRGNLTAILREVRQGTSFIVTSRGEVLAEIGPPSAAVRPPRRPGALLGQIEMAEDFDTLPPDILAAIDGGEG